MVEKIMFEYGDSVFDYDVTRHKNGFSAQISNGDEIYCSTIPELSEAVYQDVVHIMWDSYPTPNGKMWNNQDLDNMITFINARSDRRAWFLHEIEDKINTADFNAIKSVLKEGYAEYFDHYDSDVAEKFILMCENITNKYF